MPTPAIKDKQLVQSSTFTQGLAGKEPTINAGTNAQYFRGDKTWQALNKAAVGLDNVDNTSDANKPVSSAVSLALGNKLDTSERGAVNGVASLDGTGKVPSSQLPSFVDDVLEFANLGSFPATGESGKIYITLDSNKTYRWSGSAYVEISASPGSTDAVTEGVGNLYFTEGRVRSTILTGLSTVTNAAISAADSILGALGKLQKQITDLTSSKEGSIAIGNASQYYRGDKSWQDLAGAVRSTVLTGLSTVTISAIVATDSVLGALGKLQAQITDIGISKATVYGSVNLSNVVSGWGGFSLTGITGGGSFLDNGTTHGYWRSATSFLWTCDNNGLFLAKGDIGSSSDETLKKNWRALDSDFIKRLANIKHGIYDRTDIDATQVGVSAQSVLKEAPDLQYTVHEGPDGKLTVAYANAAMVSVVELAIDAVRKDELIAQQAELIQKLTERVVALENKTA